MGIKTGMKKISILIYRILILWHGIGWIVLVLISMDIAIYLVI